MSDRMHIATRKGVFTVRRSANGWNVADAEFLGDNATMLLQDPRDRALYVALDHGHFGTKLHRSDEGATWKECAVPSYPPLTEKDERKQQESGEVGARRDYSKLSEIWELATGGEDQNGLIWAGTIPGGLFRSDDRGESWHLVESLWHRDERWQWFGGGKDSPGIHSISIHPHNADSITLGISCGGVWHSDDAGQSWELRANGMRAEYMPPDSAYDPNIQDPHRLARCRQSPDHLWVQHHNGIFRSEDGGMNWAEMKDVKPSGFGFAVVVHPADPQRAWFVPGVKDECRIPVDGKFVVLRTCDGGESFEALSSGLPSTHCYDIVYRHALDIDTTGERLAMGSSTGSLWVSENGGDDWLTISNHLPPIHCVRFAAGD